MAYDERLALRVRALLAGQAVLDEKKMFGGLTFMVNGHMCCGILGDELMLRVGPEQHGAMLAHEHARAMDFTGRRMRGMVMVAPAGLASDEALAAWLRPALGFVSTLPPK
ncbi:MAG: TfoX/Sxy family protein [Kouleothrix sp.]|jgi:hypothetical protein|nr:TfoX/Sxy family protein [Kouleothrix sp.]